MVVVTLLELARRYADVLLVDDQDGVEEFATGVATMRSAIALAHVDPLCVPVRRAQDDPDP
jgi:hypothetical protein